MKRIVSVALVLCLLLLCGCARTPVEPSAPSTQPSSSPTAPTSPESGPTEASDEPTEPPATEPNIFARNPLSGLPLETPNENRTIAVVINNIRQALPHHGVSQADIIYEILAEGGVTRCLALYNDVSDVEKIGSVRSARTYFIDLAEAYDAILVHAGGSEYAYAELRASGWDHLDGITGSSASYFYRDQARLSSGYALEHTLFTTGPNILAYAEKQKLPLTREGGMNYGLLFAEDGTPNGESARKVVIHFRSSGKTTTMTYDDDTGLYNASEYGKDYVDGNTGNVMTFRNVLVLYAKTSSDGYRMFADLVGEGTGYFACGGKLIPICWSRTSDDQPFAYTLEDGTPLTFGTGTSYIGVVPEESPVDYE